MASDVIFSANNNEEVLILPVVPEIEVNKPQNNEEFETINNGVISLIGDEGLITFSITSLFPCNPYKWSRPNSFNDGFVYVDFFNKWRRAKVPIRIVVSRPNGTEWFNMPIIVENFKYKVKRNGDIDYTLDIKEYRFVKVGV